MPKKRKRKPSALKGGLGGTPVAPLVVKSGTLIDARTPGKDLRLINSAVKNGWQIPDRAFSELPEAMLAVAMSEEVDDRARVSAAKVLCTMHGQVQQVNKTTVNVGVVVNNGEDLLD